MTQEQKDLLIKDLSARLHYGVKCCVKNNHKVCGILNGIVGENIHLYSSGCGTYNISDIKPYLFPLSSMTEEQKKELEDILIELSLKAISDEIGSEVVASYEIDFYNKNHFDYRGLIEKGLAKDATGLNIY